MRATVLALLCCAAVASGQPPSLTLQSVDGNALTITRDDLAKLPQHVLNIQERSSPVVFEGVFLIDVLAKVGVPSGEKLGGKTLSQYLLVEAADGYKVVFALPELDPAFREHAVYLVTKRDGKPLSDQEGPFRTVVPDEKRPTRWVRRVTALRVRQSP